MTIKSMRLLTALCDRADARAELVADALWSGYFCAADAASAKQPDDDDVLYAACVHAELNADEIKSLLADAKSDAVKQRLKDATAELIALGAFGMPSIFVEKDGERKRYFGSDRFELIAFDFGLKWQGPQGKR